MNFSNIVQALRSAPPEKPFVTMWQDEDACQTWNFAAFTELAESSAEQLYAAGLRAQDRVILILPQSVELMGAFVGAMMLGATPAILAYPNFKVEPSKYRFGLEGVSKNLGARIIAIDEGFPQEMMQYLPQDGSIRLAIGKRPVRSKPSSSLPDLSPDALAFIQHSAGTTGLQKGVALSHESVLRQLRHLSESLKVQSNDCIYSWLPLYHDMGLIACFIFPMVYHLHVVMQSPTDWVMQPRMMLQAIDRYHCTLSWIPNFAYQFLARRVNPEDMECLDLSCLRGLINCSEPVRWESMQEFLEAFEGAGLKRRALQSSYAMAENVFAVTQSDLQNSKGSALIWVDGEEFRRSRRVSVVSRDAESALCLVSSGSVIAGNEVCIHSDEGKPLSDGNVGEIYIRGDSLFSGYFNRSDLTEKALHDGWYMTGDLGFLLDGELFVVGRKKDLIIVAGKNIYPQDVEEIICRHPAIHDGRAVAFGIFNPDLGTEDIVAVAEVESATHLSESTGIEKALKQELVGNLGVAVRAVYLKPAKWIIKSTAGKAARSSTRAKLLSEHPELRYEGITEASCGRTVQSHG